MVPVRPHRPPFGHGARHAVEAGGPGLVRHLGPSVRYRIPRGLRLHGGPGGSLFEEPGRRGFALPRLQRLHGPLVGGLILGSLWALWHLPGFLVPQKLPPSGTVMDFVRFALALIALAYIIQWVFNNTGGSVFMAILTHATWNTFYSAVLVEVFPAPAVVGSYLNLTIAAWVLVLVIIAVTRGRLGYRPEASQAPRVR